MRDRGRSWRELGEKRAGRGRGEKMEERGLGGGGCLRPAYSNSEGSGGGRRGWIKDGRHNGTDWMGSSVLGSVAR